MYGIGFTEASCGLLDAFAFEVCLKTLEGGVKHGQSCFDYIK